MKVLKRILSYSLQGNYLENFLNSYFEGDKEYKRLKYDLMDKRYLAESISRQDGRPDRNREKQLQDACAKFYNFCKRKLQTNLNFFRSLGSSQSSEERIENEKEIHKLESYIKMLDSRIRTKDCSIFQ